MGIAGGMEAFVGRRFGGYRVTRYIARGGMGVVFEGVQESLDRPVAIKILYPHLSVDPSLRERFDREARAVSRLNHPNIVRILDYGHDGEYHFMVMDFVEGESLRERLEQTRRQGLTLQPAVALGVVRQVGAALEHAHQLGFVHRDVKPGNIMLARDGRVVLTDFGVVKILGNVQVTSAGTMVGTPEYMAPEQGTSGAAVGPASDQYALAIVAYEMLLGRVPFTAQTSVAILHLHATAPPTPPGLIVPWFPPEAEAVLLRALAKRPEDRFPTIAQFVDELTSAADPLRSRTNPPVAAATLVEPRPEARTQSTLSVTPEPIPAVATVVDPPRPPGPPTTVAAGQGEDGSGGRTKLIAAVIVLLLALGIGGFLLAAALGGDDEQQTGSRGDDATATAKLATEPAQSTASGTSLATVPTSVVAVVATDTAAPAGVTKTVDASTPEAVATDTTEPSPEATATTAAATEVVVPEGFKEVIVFTSRRGGVHDSQIYVMNPDGSDQHQLTFSRGHSWGPRVSPDGQLLLFSSVAPGEHSSHDASGGGATGTGNHDIYVAASNGTGIAKLTQETSWDNAWTFSPDGQRITFTSDRDGNWEIYTMALDGSDVVRLTDDAADDGWPCWTPDGSQIVFASNRTGNWEIHIMDADGSNVRQVTELPGSYDTYPFVSPDGEWIAFSSQNEAAREGEIYLVSLDGSRLVRLTNTVALNYAPSWSPDGSKILFVSDRDGNENIYIMNRDGTDQVRLTDDPGEDTTPAWAIVPVQ